MAILKISIRPDGMVFTYTDVLAARGFRTALYDSVTRSEVFPASEQPQAEAPLSPPPLPPPPPETFEVLTLPEAGSAAAAVADTERPEVAALQTLPEMREHAVAVFGVQPAARSKEEMRAKLNELYRQRDGEAGKP